MTKHPTSLWTVQQLREAFPFASAPRFLIFDRDGKYGLEVPVVVRALKMRPVRTSFKSPWQNGVAERWVESCRRDLLDHVIAVNERHLKRLLSEYVSYYHEDRTHLGLEKGTPAGEFGPLSPVASCLTSDSADCIIVTIGLPDPANLSPILNIYVRRMCPGPRLMRAFALLKATRDRFSALFNPRHKTHRAIFEADDILARDRQLTASRKGL